MHPENLLNEKNKEFIKLSYGNEFIFHNLKKKNFFQRMDQAKLALFTKFQIRLQVFNGFFITAFSTLSTVCSFSKIREHEKKKQKWKFTNRKKVNLHTQPKDLRIHKTILKNCFGYVYSWSVRLDDLKNSIYTHTHAYKSTCNRRTHSKEKMKICINTPTTTTIYKYLSRQTHVIHICVHHSKLFSFFLFYFN